MLNFVGDEDLIPPSLLLNHAYKELGNFITMFTKSAIKWYAPGMIKKGVNDDQKNGMKKCINGRLTAWDSMSTPKMEQPVFDENSDEKYTDKTNTNTSTTKLTKNAPSQPSRQLPKQLYSMRHHHEATARQP